MTRGHLVVCAKVLSPCYFGRECQHCTGQCNFSRYLPNNHVANLAPTAEQAQNHH